MLAKPLGRAEICHYLSCFVFLQYDRIIDTVSPLECGKLESVSLLLVKYFVDLCQKANG